MYHPWKPIDRPLGLLPSLSWQVEGRTLTLQWSDTSGFKMNVSFGASLVGMLVYDESSYASTSPWLLPSDSELKSDAQKHSAWRSVPNLRKHLYGDLGQFLYEKIDTYFIVGNAVVLLLDIADSEPVAEIEHV